MTVTSLILAAMLSKATVLSMGPMAVEPKLDNVISRVEIENSSANYGLMSAEKQLMASRYTMAYVGWTEHGVYVAVRAALPTPPQKYSDVDAVTVSLLPPGAAAPTDFRKHLATESRALKGIVDWGVEASEIEFLIPWSELGMASVKDGEAWGLQIKVDYSSRRETCYLHLPEAAGEMATFIPDRTMPIGGLVHFSSLESWKPSANYLFKFRVTNTTRQDVKLTSKSRVYRGLGFSKLDSDAVSEKTDVQSNQILEMHGQVVKAGTMEEYNHREWSIWGGNASLIAYDLSANGKVCYRRQVRWDVNNGLGWKDDVGLPEMRAGYWPTAKRVRAQQLVKPRFPTPKRKIEVVGADGKVYASTDKSSLDVTLPNLPEGDYRIVLTAWDKDGKVYTHEKTFSEKKFEWEGNSIGKDRVVIPPFTPIKIDGASQDIAFLQTGYSFGDGILFDGAYASDENLLAAPIRFVLDGREFKVTAAKWLEQSPDRAVRELQAELPGLKATIVQDFDYDGFCEVTVRIRPEQAMTVNSLDLYTPLKDNGVWLYSNEAHDDARQGPAPDFKLKTGEGEVWNSAQDRKPTWTNNNAVAIQSYVWFGGVEKGVMRHYDSREHWSLKPGTIVSDMVRKDGAVTLHDRFINRPTAWDTKEKWFRFRFQPTPVKPQLVEFTRLAENMYTYHAPSNSFNYHWGTFTQLWPINVGMTCYPNGDLSALKWLFKNSKSATEAEYHAMMDRYVEKNADFFRSFPMMTAQDYRNGFRNAEWRRLNVDRYAYYIDPMMLSCYWPEYEKYKSEWFVLDWPWENVANEYLCLVSDSRIDKVLWDGKKALEAGYDGIYYDCFSSCRHSNFVAIPETAYPTSGGGAVAALDVFMQWRKLMKRTSTMCYVMGKNTLGRPLSEIHMTNHHIVPVSSFSTLNLSTERSGQGGEFQIRFPEGYTLTEIIGRASGAAAHNIVSTRKGPETRQEAELYSLMGWMCAYGHFSIEDQGIINAKWFEQAWNVPFDYGWGRPDVVIPHWYYDGKPQLFTHNAKDVRLNVAEKLDGSGMLLMFGNLGDAAELSFRSTAGNDYTYIDAITGEAVDPSKLAIKRFGFRMVYAKLGSRE